MKKLLLLLTLLLTAATSLHANTGTTTTEGTVSTWTLTPTTLAEWQTAFGVANFNSVPEYLYIDKDAGTKWNCDATFNPSDKGEEKVTILCGTFSTGEKTNYLQFGSGTYGAKNVTLSTSDFPGTITKITIKNACTASNANAILTVSVGGTSYSTSSNITDYKLPKQADRADVSFVGTSSGNIIITFQQNTNKKYIGFTGLEVTYDTATGAETMELGEITATLNDDTTPFEGLAKTIFVDEKITFKAANAESISVAVNEGEADLKQGDSYTWTPTATGEYTLDVTANGKDAEGNTTSLNTKYTITVTNVAEPTITIVGDDDGNGGYYTGATATITADAADIEMILYTLDGTDPVESETAVWADGKTVTDITLPVGETLIKAVAVDADGDHSAVKTETVTVVKKQVNLAWSATTYEFTYDGTEPALPTLTKSDGIEVKYASDKPEVATIDAEGNVTLEGYGTTTISATYAGTEEYEAATAEYQLTIKNPNVQEAVDHLNVDNFKYVSISTGSYHYNTYTSPVTKIEYEGCYYESAGMQLNKDKSAGFRVVSNDDWAAKSIVIKWSSVYSGHNLYLYANSDKAYTSLSDINKFATDDALKTFTSGVDDSRWSFTTSPKYLGMFSLQTIKIVDIEITWAKEKVAEPVSEETDEYIDIKVDDLDYTLHYMKNVIAEAETPNAGPSRVDQVDKTSLEVTDGQWKDSGARELRVWKSEAAGYDYAFKAVKKSDSTVESGSQIAFRIAEDGTLTGVEEALADADENAPVEYFDLQGRKVMNPANGLYIRRQGNKVEKLIIR